MARPRGDGELDLPRRPCQRRGSWRSTEHHTVESPGAKDPPSAPVQRTTAATGRGRSPTRPPAPTGAAAWRGPSERRTGKRAAWRRYRSCADVKRSAKGPLPSCRSASDGADLASGVGGSWTRTPSGCQEPIDTHTPRTSGAWEIRTMGAMKTLATPDPERPTLLEPNSAWLAAWCVRCKRTGRDGTRCCACPRGRELARRYARAYADDDAQRARARERKTEPRTERGTSTIGDLLRSVGRRS